MSLAQVKRISLPETEQADSLGRAAPDQKLVGVVLSIWQAQGGRYGLGAPGLAGHLPLVLAVGMPHHRRRGAYSPYRRIHCDPRGMICCVSSSKKRVTEKVSVFALKKSLSEV